MNVLYIVFKALLGGHVLSALTIAREMRRHGIKPRFAATPGTLFDSIMNEFPIEPLDIPIYHGSRQTYFTWRSFTTVRRMRILIRQHNIDLVHAFDARSYMHAYMAGLLEKIPVLVTLCGGIDPYYNIPAAPFVIVFSEEQKKKMAVAFHWPSERIQLIRTRLDLNHILNDHHHLSEKETTAYRINPSLPIVMMISSFDATKIRSVYKVLDAAETLFSRGFEFQLLLIGGNGELFNQAMNRGNQICERFGIDKIIFTGPVINAYRLLQRADIVLGVGRSAFEGMAYGHPTLIVGENGFAGVVGPEQIEDIAWYNFSGRNQKQDTGIEAFTTELGDLLRNKDRRYRLGIFGRNFVKQEIDVTKGAERILQIYRMIRDPISPITRREQWISFIKCLIPIIRDNSIHSIKQTMKST